MHISTHGHLQKSQKAKGMCIHSQVIFGIGIIPCTVVPVLVAAVHACMCEHYTSTRRQLNQTFQTQLVPIIRPHGITL